MLRFYFGTKGGKSIDVQALRQQQMSVVDVHLLLICANLSTCSCSGDYLHEWRIKFNYNARM